ncbi:MAG: hypothetical protein LBS55_09255, partial [Prevotellaceae bacterium]|nr:hypothetical protein [Prevotellaceae bacterium]
SFLVFRILSLPFYKNVVTIWRKRYYVFGKRLLRFTPLRISGYFVSPSSQCRARRRQSPHSRQVNQKARSLITKIIPIICL